MYLISNQKKECCGCTACQQICHVHAITMVPDEDGFLFPVKNTDICTKCGACEKACPFINPQYQEMPLNVFACRLRDEQECKRSTSGGLFYALANYVIENDGIVYGTTMDNHLQVYHIAATNQRSLQKLRGSKYVQSALNDSFREIKRLLKSGKLVLFSGTGCQVAGLKRFLKNDFTNLITVDLICHGVPSQKLFNEHIAYLENKHRARIMEYQFRNNETWNCCEQFKLQKKNKTKEVKQPTFRLSPYLYSFMYAYTYRESCYVCPFAKLPRQGDITIGDYWGIKRYFPNFNATHGASLGIINSQRGVKLWNEISKTLIYVTSSLKDACANNANIEVHTPMPPQRYDIFKKIREVGYAKIAQTTFRPKRYYYIRAKYLIKAILHKLNKKWAP